MTFAPVALKDDEFVEHVSRDIMKNDTMPDDFEATMWYVLYQLSKRNREIFLKVERDHIPVRAVGLEYGISGQRIFEINEDIKSTLHTKWGDFLKIGIMKFIQKTVNTAQILGESNAKESYYKLGYTDGYDDGIINKPHKHFATEDYNRISLSDLSLSYRTQHYLFDNGLLNLSEIIECGDKLLDIRNLGKNSYQELAERLTEFGVDMKRHFPKMMKKYNIVLED